MRRLELATKTTRPHYSPTHRPCSPGARCMAGFPEFPMRHSEGHRAALSRTFLFQEGVQGESRSDSTQHLACWAETLGTYSDCGASRPGAPRGTTIIRGPPTQTRSPVRFLTPETIAFIQFDYNAANILVSFKAPQHRSWLILEYCPQVVVKSLHFRLP